MSKNDYKTKVIQTEAKKIVSSVLWMTFLMLSYITNDIGICYSQKMASNILPPASWAWYCTFSDLLMHICTYHKKRDSAHIHKMQPEWIKENFRELEGLQFYHQCLRFAKKKKKKNHLMDICVPGIYFVSFI